MISSAARPALPQPPLPLMVDFDGTMHLQDTTWEAMKWLFFHNIWGFLKAAVRYRPSTRAPLKMVLITYTEAAPWKPDLTWDGRILSLMNAARAEGREVMVVTGSVQRLAERILADNGLKYPVLGTTSAQINLIATQKARALVEKYGERGFDYIGNSNSDLPVWAHARAAMVVNANAKVEAAAKALGNVAWVLPAEK